MGRSKSPTYETPLTTRVASGPLELRSETASADNEDSLQRYFVSHVSPRWNVLSSSPVAFVQRKGKRLRVLERHAQGSLDDLLAMAPDVRCLFNHDESYLLGRTGSTRRTLRWLDDRSEGNAWECELPDTELGRSVRTLCEREDLTGSSFTFAAGDVRYEEGQDPSGKDCVIRTVYRISYLRDVGPVTFPAFASEDRVSPVLLDKRSADTIASEVEDWNQRTSRSQVALGEGGWWAAKRRSLHAPN